ncbi:MAG: Cof-type HAD-IIB family hydrolase [Eubacterium sp.]|nr:Cof-type HAD-IIB family hydrolase [Eubacterium sp.]
MIKMIASDLDGTLLLDSRTVSARNRMALTRAAASGIEVVVASGRVLTSLPESVFRIPGIRYAITSNGAAIYRIPSDADTSSGADASSDVSSAPARILPGFQPDKRNNLYKKSYSDFQSILARNSQNYSDSFCGRLLSSKRIYHRPLSEKAVLDLLELTAAYPSDLFPLSYEVFINGVAYACTAYVNEPGNFGASSAYVDYVRTTRVMKDDIRGFIFQHRKELDGLDLVVGDDALCEQLRNKIHSTLRNIYTTSSVSNRIENSSPEAGKGAALRFLSSQLKIRKEDIVAFGDADNDIDLLTSAGTGIAMENGTERCRKSADYVAGRYDSDAVAEVLQARFAI